MVIDKFFDDLIDAQEIILKTNIDTLIAQDPLRQNLISKQYQELRFIESFSILIHIKPLEEAKNSFNP